MLIVEEKPTGNSKATVTYSHLQEVKLSLT